MERLKATYRKEAYPNERVELFWRAFKSVAAGVFTEAVDECIGTQRQPPLFKELTEAVAQAGMREAERVRHQMHRSSFLGIMEDALPKTPNKEFAAACVKLVKDKIRGVINSRQFEEGCQYLEQVAAINRRK